MLEARSSCYSPFFAADGRAGVARRKSRLVGIVHHIASGFRRRPASLRMPAWSRLRPPAATDGGTACAGAASAIGGARFEVTRLRMQPFGARHPCIS